MSALANSPRLVFRLSSLGDVVLAAAILQDGVRTDWVCADEYAGLLQGHPSIGQVIGFSRREGLAGWMRLCARVAREGKYAEVVDLHDSLRTRVARAIWLLRSPQTPWRRLRKPRARRLGYAVFKRLWPRDWRPPAYRERARAMGGAAPVAAPPVLSHLPGAGARGEEANAPYFVVMPASRWAAKEWPAPAFAEALAELSREPHAPRFYVLGRPSDRASHELYGECARRGIAAVESWIGEHSYAEVARRLARARGYIGMDTGLAHLAEAVGTDAFVLHGPLTPDYGFGPWRPGSQAAGKNLWCRPCSKDGRACFRVTRRYACLRELKPAEIQADLTAWVRGRLSQAKGSPA